MTDDESKCGRDAAVQAGSSENSSPHFAALLRFQSHLGLGHTMSDLLYGHHGPLQRRVQEQNVRRRFIVSGRFNRRRDIFHRHRIEFPHDVRRTRRRSGIRPKSDPHELPQIVVRHRSPIVPTLRRIQRLRSRRRRK